MKQHQWRLLLLFGRHSSPLLSSTAISRPLPLHRHLSSIPSFLHHPNAAYPPLPTPFLHPIPFQHRYFSSSEPISADSAVHSLIINTFSKPIPADDIKRQLDSNNLLITHDLVLNVLKNLDSNVDAALNFFDWVLETDGARLSSKAYNFMLGILGVNSHLDKFWDLVEDMKNKGYGVHRGTYLKVLPKFEKEAPEPDLNRLKGLFDYRKPQDSPEAVSSTILKIIRQGVWTEDVENKIRQLDAANFSSDMVAMVLQNLGKEPAKALIFFRWVEESDLFKHDQQTYNALALVLGREDCIDRFWNLLGGMKDSGFHIYSSTYISVLDRFVKRKMLKDAVDMYEFAMGNCESKPSIRDCVFLLKKIAVAKELDMELFSKVLNVTAQSGHVLPDSAAHSVFKSLASVNRIDQFNVTMDAMRASGLNPGIPMQSKIAYRLSKIGRKDEVDRYLQDLEKSGSGPDPKTWVSLVEGYCLAGELEQAFECFQKSIEKAGCSSAGYALEMLVDAYCCCDRAVEASKILANLVKNKGMEPQLSTYKKLIMELLDQGGFNEALGLLDLMKSHGFPPFLDPFVEYVSRRGKANHALMFLQAMTYKKYPSTSVFIQVFEAYFKVGRRKEAQNLLAICPGYIKSQSDVLNLFLFKSQKYGKAATVAA